VRLARQAEDVEIAQLLASLQAFLAQLNNIHAAPEHGVEEVRQVTLPLARVRAQVQPGSGQPR
jgi:hypothetical protein